LGGTDLLERADFYGCATRSLQPNSNSKEAEMGVAFVMLLVLAGLFVLGLAPRSP
jgi:hypothetical protein